VYCVQCSGIVYNALQRSSYKELTEILVGLEIAFKSIEIGSVRSLLCNINKYK